MNKTQDKDYSDEDIIMMIRKDEGTMTRAMEILYGREDLQRNAYRIFGKYRRTLDLFTWQDVFLESIVRLVTGVLFGSGGKVGSLPGYFSGICNNYCKELLRKGERKLEGGEDWLIHPEQIVFDQELEELLRVILRQQTEQCQHIFNMLFFSAEPWSMEDVADELGLGGARSAITTFYRCKQKLLAFIRGHDRLQELLKSYL